jgi:amino acid adenylation domain-containing protein
MIEGGSLQSQVQYWQKQFEDGIPKLNFMADRPRPHTFTFEGANHAFTLGPQLTEQVRSLGRRHGATIQMTLLAVLEVLLHKYTGQDDMVIGCGIAGRRHADVERIAGMFVNSLAIRGFPQGGKRFSAFLKETVATSLAAYENQDLQFEDLLDMLKVERDPSRNPVFDISLIVQNFERSKAIQAPLFKKLDPPHPLLPSLHKYDAGTSKFDMDWFVEETEHDIAINVEYYSAIFNRPTIERLAAHFVQVLATVGNNPDILLADINLLDAAAVQQMLQHYVMGEKQSFPPDATVHGLFERQCFLHPASTAVDHNGDTLSFQGLNERSNQLSKFLQKGLGLSPEARVGILQSQGMALTVSVMGTLKAGCAYVPMDSEYPEDRLLYMIEDAGIEVLLTEKRVIELANSLQWRSKTLQHVVCADSEDYYGERGVLKNDLMRKDLWDHIGELAEDAIGQGGWINSYTGEDFTPAEMQEYSDNIYQKLKEHLRPDMRVLEIGCSSGLTMFNLAPLVGSYYGTDLSSAILEKTALAVNEKGFTNITLACMPADQIDTVPEDGFDLVIINSVIQCFNGHNYLRDVLVKAIGKMKNKGLLFVGDIMDEDRRQALIDDMVAFKQQHHNPAWHTKTDWGMELFVSRSYFEDLRAAGIGIVGTAYTDKIHTIANELTRFRYDALLKIDKQAFAKQPAPGKHQYDLRHIRQWGTDLINAGAGPGHLACIIYTSGTTGKPKGVGIEHGALVKRFVGEQALLGVGTHTVACTATNFCFDVSLLEILLPLAMGGKLAILSRDTVLSPQKLVQELQDRKVNLLQGTPSFIKGILLEGLGDAHTLSLTHIAIGGESLNEALVNELHERLPGVTINNQYGPTEAVIDAIVLKDVKSFKRNIIGRPIYNTSVFVLDDNRHLLPIGAVGELCIGGTALARGYHNREALTAEKFIANPYVPGEKLYLTGDLGRFLPDGNIEFIGRKDDQVKVRGYRIELGEIEAALLTYRQLDNAFVTANTNKAGDKELVAYVVATQPINMAELRAHIGKMLPAYMLPYHFVQLPALPMNANGKVDRKKLPEPTGSDAQATVLYQAPRNETEEKTAAIWCEILGLERVGVTDNFFEVGGHSLRVIRVLSKVRAEFGVDIKIEDVFSNPTIEFMAKEIARKKWMAMGQQVITDEKTVITI